jgi:hypothetical protein
VTREYTETELAYIQAARDQSNDELEIDNEPELSIGEDDGCWVAAWVWIADHEAGVCRICKQPGANGDDSYDGMCPTCADHTEPDHDSSKCSYCEENGILQER